VCVYTQHRRKCLQKASAPGQGELSVCYKSASNRQVARFVYLNVRAKRDPFAVSVGTAQSPLVLKPVMFLSFGQFCLKIKGLVALVLKSIIVKLFMPLHVRSVS
jgi:hypothetical protein